MHLLTTGSATLDDLAEPIDLGQTPADIVALSFTDSDLAGLAAAWKAGGPELPSLRLAALRDLRHPMSVDLWIDRVARHARIVLVRILGGYDWWRYGVDQLAAAARAHGVKLALLPGECREEDPRLTEASTLAKAELDALLAFFREGGPDNMRALLSRLASLARSEAASALPVEVPRAGFYRPGQGVVAEPILPPEGAATVPILFYRSMLLAADVAPIDALCAALGREGLHPVPVFVASLKESASLTFAEQALAALAPAAVVAATAFASGAEPGGETLFDRLGAPVFQAVIATTKHEAWEKNLRGLAPADLAMHVVLPELDGRILGGALSFKGEQEADAELGYRPFANRPEPDRVDAFARRVAAVGRLRRTPRAERRLAVLMPDYPGAAGRTGYAVGLDVPQSVLAMLQDLKDAGYTVDGIPDSPRELLDRLDDAGTGLAATIDESALPLAEYRVLSATLPPAAIAAVQEAWGDALGEVVLEGPDGNSGQTLADASGDLMPSSSGLSRGSAAAGISDHANRVSVASLSGVNDHLAADPRDKPEDDGVEGWVPSSHAIALDRSSAAVAKNRLSVSEIDHATEAQKSPPPVFRFRAATFGNVTVALAPDRGRSADRRADYHDPTLPPRHALVAFGFWLRQKLGCHALVHVGAHGTLEWLPGKTVALSQDCFPEIVAGGLPVVYPFIVSNPGEAAQAKRRIAAVTLGHLPPPLAAAGLDEHQQKLERLVDEYAQADGLDRRRRDRLARLIAETAAETGLDVEAGVARTDAPDEALRRIDAWLCDLKDLSLKDGLHVYGRAAPGEADPLRMLSADAERAALLAALDGRHIAAGPSGAPARGRSDVLPTGRNLFTADPRTMPTPTAFDLGKAAANEVLTRYLQEHGDWPRALVIDLWGSASLRTGGEEIAHGLALMGCRPQWDFATGRVTGIEVLPPGMLSRPRVDVTWRISGLFRDMFPTQVALMDAAASAVAQRGEEGDQNPLAEAARDGAAPRRVFGSAPGTYGAGIEERLAAGDWEDREELGRAYLEATSHAYGGAEGLGEALPGAFADRVAEADLLVHSGDDPGRDILEGSADVAFVGGFAAAVAALGGKADVVMLDTTDPARPRPRSLRQAVTRVVRARATNPRFIEGQLRHGPRGASEFAETVDRLVGFAETTDAIPGALIEALYDAYLGDRRVRAFLLEQNPEAASFIVRRFASARRRGLWHPLRNFVDADLAAFAEEAAGERAA